MLPSGGFIDWSCDCDFADLDNDGDLDLVHSSYGSSLSGDVPTRVYMNDGDGYFSEYNPSGIKLTTSSIPPGSPALWCDGTQEPNTHDTTGAHADIATSALDIDIGDIDGDFDIDLLLGARVEAPRIFRNRLKESGSFGFRDYTWVAFSEGYWYDGNNYAQGFGDMDNDGDLDLLGINYPGLFEASYTNIGKGVYSQMQVLHGSINADNDVEFFDADNDGDLDAYIAAFIGQNKVYRNDHPAGGPSGSIVWEPVPGGLTGLPVMQRTLDPEIADVDQDGDYDVMTAEDKGNDERLQINDTHLSDTLAPYLIRTEQLTDTQPGAQSIPVRAQVYDNAPYYLTWYNPTYLEVRVNGARLPDMRAMSSQGQIFRATIPGNLVGTIAYRFRSSDKHGNTAETDDKVYVAGSGPIGQLFGGSSQGSQGTPTITLGSVPLPGSTLYVIGGNAPAGALSFMAFSDHREATPISFHGGLVINLGAPYLLLTEQPVDAEGKAVLAVPVSGDMSGQTFYAQFATFDGIGSKNFACSQGIEIQVP